MASDLRAKLRAMGAAPAPPKRATERGVLLYTDRRPLNAQLRALSGTALRRIGWAGGAFDVRNCLFMDTETTGLSGGAGTVAFLVGIGYVDGDVFRIEQYLMRDYADEPEMIDALARRMDNFEYVCTFNGRNFDMPLLKARFTMCRMHDRWRELDNLDLLYPARRTWKLRLGSCRLSRLEEYILGAPRSDDLPGSEVPRRYFEYLKTGDLSLLDDIVQHNRQDIATLADLLAHLCCAYAEPERLTERLDVFSVGRALENQGELKTARELYHISAIPAPAGTLAAITGNKVAGMANWRIYLLARRSRDAEGMRAVLEQMLMRKQMSFAVRIELAKLYEHKLGNPERALEHVQIARTICPEESLEALGQRERRLMKKLNRKLEE